MEQLSLAPLRESQSHLRQHFAEFAAQWRATKLEWRDEPARRFEQQHLADLSAVLRRVTAAADEFAEEVTRIQRTLDDPAKHSG